MNLKTGASYWSNVSPGSHPGEPLQKDAKCDVIVLGAGLSGSMIAHSLCRAGLDVVLLDKRELGTGSTSASTALVLYEIDTPLTELIRRRGRAAAVRSYECCREAITTLEKLVRPIDGRCEFRSRPSIYLSSQPSDLKGLKQEFEARKRHGFPVEFWGPSDLKQRFSFSAPGAIWSLGGAEVNPLAVTRELVHNAQKKGLRFFSKTEVVGITESRNEITARTGTGHDVKARWLVKASGFETYDQAARRVVKLKSTYVMVTRPVRQFYGWHERCLIWETRRPYLYARTTHDDRIMIGGGDEDFQDPAKRDRLIKRKTAALGMKLSKLFPQISIAPQYHWAGTFGETKDGLPYIGRIKSDSRILYALCYGANGTNFAVMAAGIIRDAISGKPNHDAKLFAFDR